MKIYIRGNGESLDSVFSGMEKSTFRTQSKIYCLVDENTAMVGDYHTKACDLAAAYLNRTGLLSGKKMESLRKLLELIPQFLEQQDRLGPDARKDQDFRKTCHEIGSILEEYSDHHFNGRYWLIIVTDKGGVRHQVYR